jgi:hypothetical protein
MKQREHVNSVTWEDESIEEVTIIMSYNDGISYHMHQYPFTDMVNM